MKRLLNWQMPMTARAVNVYAVIHSVILVVAFVYYELFGRPFGVTYAFLPMLTFALTYTILAIHQARIAAVDPLRRVRIPVPLRWVMALWFVSFALLLWFVILHYFFPALDNTTLRRFMWLQASLAFIWFMRRFIIWDEPNDDRTDQRLNGDNPPNEETDIL